MINDLPDLFDFSKPVNSVVLIYADAETCTSRTGVFWHLHVGAERCCDSAELGLEASFVDDWDAIAVWRSPNAWSEGRVEEQCAPGCQGQLRCGGAWTPRVEGATRSPRVRAMLLALSLRGPHARAVRSRVGLPKMELPSPRAHCASSRHQKKNPSWFPEQGVRAKLYMWNKGLTPVLHWLRQTVLSL